MAKADAAQKKANVSFGKVRMVWIVQPPFWANYLILNSIVCFHLPE
ncbi:MULTISPECIES: hypothetical protein [Pantoea]|nr:MULTISPECIES: hypothetical protein [Pantoea]MDI3367415.1 hypothetical protein [Pantoea sp. V108_6]URL12940.1 hypothetical protein LVR30_11725 [Pantoea ananatis]CRH37284.1 hypothetical protein BN1184_AM_01580 [Pantoea ananatis]